MITSERRNCTYGVIAPMIVGILLSSACAGINAAHASDGASSANEEAIFVTVALRMREQARVPFRVDPRPLSADPTIVELTPWLSTAVPEHVTTPRTVFADVPGSVVERRRRIIERAGIGSADVMAYARCPGGLRPPIVPPTAQEGCPTSEHVEVVIGLSRPGGAYLPSSPYDERSQASLGYRTARVIKRELGPHGATQTAIDVVVVPDGAGRWHVVKAVPLVVLE